MALTGTPHCPGTSLPTRNRWLPRRCGGPPPIRQTLPAGQAVLRDAPSPEQAIRPQPDLPRTSTPPRSRFVASFTFYGATKVVAWATRCANPERMAVRETPSHSLQDPKPACLITALRAEPVNLVPRRQCGTTRHTGLLLSGTLSRFTGPESRNTLQTLLLRRNTAGSSWVQVAPLSRSPPTRPTVAISGT